MSLADAIKKLKFDKRLVEWNLYNKKLTKEELNKHLEELPDCTDNVEPLFSEKTEEEETQSH